MNNFNNNGNETEKHGIKTTYRRRMLASDHVIMHNMWGKGLEARWHLSTQGRLTLEYLNKQWALARWHVNTQDTLSCEHVSMQDTLSCEHVFSTQSM